MAFRIVNKQMINVCVCVEPVHLGTLNRVVEEINKSVNSSTCVVSYYVFLDKIYNRARVAQLYSRNYPQCAFTFKYINQPIDKNSYGVFDLSKYVYLSVGNGSIDHARFDLLPYIYNQVGNFDMLCMCFVEHNPREDNNPREMAIPMVQIECIEDTVYLKLVNGPYLSFDKQEESLGGTYSVLFSSTPPTNFPKCDILETTDEKGEWTIQVDDHYLGAPNKNRALHLYPNEGKYTRFVALNNSTYMYNGFLFDRSKFEIVVARYRENVDWIAPYRDLVTVYTKCAECTAPDAARVVPLPNVGRESHTYLRHVIDNYDTLSDNTLFTQCGIYEHDTHSIHEYMECADKHLFHITNFGTIYAKDRKYGYLKHKGKWLDEYNRGDMLRETMTFQQWWHKYVRKTLPHINRFKFSHGAIFSVTKSKIIENSIEYYESLIQSVDQHKNPESGHYFERAWYYIFNGCG